MFPYSRSKNITRVDDFIFLQIKINKKIIKHLTGSSYLLLTKYQKKNDKSYYIYEVNYFTLDS